MRSGDWLAVGPPRARNWVDLVITSFTIGGSGGVAAWIAEKDAWLWFASFAGLGFIALLVWAGALAQRDRDRPLQIRVEEAEFNINENLVMLHDERGNALVPPVRPSVCAAFLSMMPLMA